MLASTTSLAASIAVIKAALIAAEDLGLPKQALLEAVDPAGAVPNLPAHTLMNLERAMARRRGADVAARNAAPQRSFAADVRGEIAKRVAAGDTTISIGHIARALMISPRTLQRRLEDEETTFVAVLDGVRREIALACLGDANVAIKEAVYRAGYSEPSTFYRAFRRWTGVTPADYRSSLA